MTDAPRNDRSLISIVVPLHNEQPNVQPLLEAIGQAMGPQPYEVLAVDDGSTDGTAEALQQAARQDPRIIGLVLSRNFGHQYALAAGLSRARGQAVVTMDGDLQHPPEKLPEFITRWKGGDNIVQGRRVRTEQIGWLKNLQSRCYYRLFNALSGLKLQEGMADYRLLDRCVVDEINRLCESQLFLRGLIAWMGYRRSTVDFTAPARQAGQSKYTLRKMLQLAGGGVLSFSPLPMRLGIALGLVMAGLSLIELLYVLIVKLAGSTVPGWASTVGLMSLFFGVLFILVGIQGEYLLRIHQRVQHRPAWLIERVIGNDQNSTSDRSTLEAPDAHP
jgi:dolichol-phosphate mannosyltransferase